MSGCFFCLLAHTLTLTPFIVLYIHTPPHIPCPCFCLTPLPLPHTHSKHSHAPARSIHTPLSVDETERERRGRDVARARTHTAPLYAGSPAVLLALPNFDRGAVWDGV